MRIESPKIWEIICCIQCVREPLRASLGFISVCRCAAGNRIMEIVIECVCCQRRATRDAEFLREEFFAMGKRKNLIKRYMHVTQSVSVCAVWLSRGRAIGTRTHTRQAIYVCTARPHESYICAPANSHVHVRCHMELFSSTKRRKGHTSTCTYHVDDNDDDDITLATRFAGNNILLRNLVPFNVFMYADNKNFIF